LVDFVTVRKCPVLLEAAVALTLKFSSGTFTPRNVMWLKIYEYVSMRPLNFISGNF